MQSGNGIDLAAIHQLLTEVAQTVRGHSERFDRIETRLGGVETRLGGVETRLGGVETRLGGVETRLGGVETRLDSHTQKLNELAVIVNEHTRKLDQFTAVVDQHGRKIDDIASGLRELRLTLYQYHEAVVGHGMSLTRLEERVQRIEEHLHLDPAAA